MITEGDEESGTGDVEYWVEKIKDRLGVPKLIMCLDSGTIDYDRLWITTSLRGVCSIILKI
jgi:acetylornithine deacetylase/succinyl-diaminopimelate desuccinylase-like protein